MTNKKNTKKGFLSSAMTLLLCCAMLIGTTFAWFTDTAQNKGNRIQAGNLGVDLQMYKEGQGYVSIASKTGDIFTSADSAKNSNDTLWEPGKTQVVYLAIKNEGNLDLKYAVDLIASNPDGQTIDMTPVMAYAIAPNVKAGDNINKLDEANYNKVKLGINEIVTKENGLRDVKLGKEVTHYFALFVHMDEDADNTYQNQSVLFDLLVKATQDTSETDSFNNEYDTESNYDQISSVNVTTADELKEAIENGAKSVSLLEDITITEPLMVTSDLTLVGNGYKITSNNNIQDTGIIKVDGQNDIDIILDNVKLEHTNGVYNRCLTVSNNTNINISIINSELKAPHYPLNVAKGNSNIKINVENSILKGYAAFQSWSDGVTATFNNSILIGHNKWVKDEWNNFATIVVNENVKNNVYTFNNCEIHADNEPNYNEQKHYDDREKENDLVFNGCTYFQNGTELEEAIK